MGRCAMFRGISARKEKLLRQRLRQEAEQASPSVSETFHERLCRAIRQGKIADTGMCSEPLPERLFLRYLAPAIAAACLILIVGALWQTVGPIVRPNRVNVVPAGRRAPAPPMDGPKIPVDVMSLTNSATTRSRGLVPWSIRPRFHPNGPISITTPGWPCTCLPIASLSNTFLGSQRADETP